MSKKTSGRGGGHGSGLWLERACAPRAVTVGSTAWSSRLATTRNVFFRVGLGMHCITCVQECTPIALKWHRRQRVRHLKQVMLQRRVSSY